LEEELELLEDDNCQLLKELELENGTLEVLDEALLGS